MKKIAVFGLGVSGLATCRYLQKLGTPVLAYDDKLEEIIQRSDGEFLTDTSAFELCSKKDALEKITNVHQIIASPGILPTHPFLQKAREIGLEIICDVEFALRELKRTKQSCSLLGITGSNGKTTVTMLITHILEVAHKKAVAVGNIGLSLLDALSQKASHYVVELSSFQLDMMTTRLFDAAVILNITPNHLNYHGTFEKYEKAKYRLQDLVKLDGLFLANEKLKITRNTFGFQSNFLKSDGEYVYLKNKREIALPSSLRATFSHDVENFLAAYGICREVGISPETIVQAYPSFKKPKHRIEFIREHRGVKYYDDSKGTNLDAVMRAVESLSGTIVLIAGGVHKGASYEIWKKPFSNKVRHVFAIGEAAPIIATDLSTAIPVTLCQNLEDAVRHAAALAERGESVLLSPGCSSYDMFKSYIERGEKFQEQVAKL